MNVSANEMMTNINVFGLSGNGNGIGERTSSLIV